MKTHNEKKTPQAKQDPAAAYGFGWICRQSRPVWGWLLLVALAGIGTACVNMIMTYVLQCFVDIATGESELSLPHNAIRAVLVLFVEGALGLAMSVAYRSAANVTAKRLRMDCARQFYGGSLLHVQRHTVSEYMTNLTVDTDKVACCLPDLVRGTVGNALSAALATVYLFSIHWKLAIALLVGIPLLIACVAVFSPVLQRTSQADAAGEEAVRGYLQDVLEKLPIFKTCAMGEKMEEKADRLLTNKVKSARRLGAAEGGSAFLNSVMGSVMFLVALGGGALLVTKGEMHLSGMIAVIQLTNYIVWPFTAVGGILSNVNQAIIAARRMRRIYELPQRPPHPRAVAGARRSCGVQLQAVSFGYDEAAIVNDANATFLGGQITGLVGESGCGKSTLLKLLAGLYCPTAGQLRPLAADGAPLPQATPSVAYVPADEPVFCDTIRANICMAAGSDDEKLRRCAAMAHIDSYIDTLPQGYDTMLCDGSLTLSSGQAQRVAIARALYQQADWLLFDEPTANLDAESIDIFLQTLAQLAPDHLCVVVTHDPRVIACCQQVWTMNQGRLTRTASVAGRHTV